MSFFRCMHSFNGKYETKNPEIQRVKVKYRETRDNMSHNCVKQTVGDSQHQYSSITLF